MDCGRSGSLCTTRILFLPFQAPIPSKFKLYDIEHICHTSTENITVLTETFEMQVRKLIEF